MRGVRLSREWDFIAGLRTRVLGPHQRGRENSGGQWSPFNRGREWAFLTGSRGAVSTL